MTKSFEKKYFGGFIKTLTFFLIFLACINIGSKIVSADNIQYIYDSLNRLIEVRYPDKVIHYTYDAAGNRTGVTVEVLVAAPTLSSLSPRGAVVGGGVLTLKINGSNFTNSSVVQWNGVDRPTTFISANELRITVNPSDIATVGTASVVVINATPSLSVSNAQSFSVVQTAAFTGRITAGANGLGNVTVNLSGSENHSAITDSDGNFNFALLANGTYTVTPSRANYSFTPSNRVVNYTGVSQTNLDFAASLVSYSISGRVARSNGTGVAGVVMALSGSQTGQVTTDSNGNYTRNAPAEGNYTLTPTLSGYTFSPTSQNFTNLSANQTADFTATNVSITHRAPFDFDGDNKTDVSIFRPSDGSWWYLRSFDTQFRVYRFGESADKLAPGDFTGDGKADIAVFRSSTGEWFIQRSEDNSFFSFPFGAKGDIAAPSDYDGDGKTDAAVFRPSTATWYILNSGGGTSIVQFGSAEDKPVPADFDGDGKADIAIFRPSDGSWWYLQSSDQQFKVFRFGVGTDKPVPGDYTGDGKAELAVFRPSTGEWYFQRSEDNSYYSFIWGQADDIPVPGDYDGDGKFDASVFRPSNFTWFMNQTTSGVGIVNFGSTGDRPVPNAFVR